MNIFSLSRKRGAIQYIYHLGEKKAFLFKKRENFKCRDILAVSTHNLTKFNTPGKTVNSDNHVFHFIFPYVTSDSWLHFDQHNLHFNQLFWYY